MFSLWLANKLHLGGQSIGLVLSINAISALISKPIYGYILDKTGVRKNTLWIITTCLILLGPFFVFMYQPLLKSNFYLGIAIGGAIIGFANLAGIAAIESYMDRAGRKYGFEFGHVRMWGAIGGACAGFLAGHFFNINPNINFMIPTLAGIIMFFIVLTMKVEVSDEEFQLTKSLKVNDVISLLKLRKFWFFILFVLGTVSWYFIIDQQFPRYYVSLFSDEQLGNKVMGYLTSAYFVFECVMLIVIPYFINKIGAKNGLILAGFIMFIRITCSGLFPNITALFFLKLLHGLELPILLISVFKYIASNFDRKVVSCMYLIGYQSINYVGIAIFGPYVGSLYDNIGFSKTYEIIGLIVLVFTMISCFTLTSTSKKETNVALVTEVAET